MNRIIKGVTAAALIALAIAGCGKTHTTTFTPPATSSAEHAAGLTAEQILGKCMPANSIVTQLEWLKTISAGRNSPDYAKGQAARHAFEGCAGVSPANDARFENQVETQAGQAAQAYATDYSKGDKTGARAAVHTFVNTTIEQDAINDR